MVRILIGLLKGAVLGGGLGYGAYAAGLNGGWNWITYGLVGVLVGLFVGKPIWKHLMERGSTVWTPVLKSIFGFGVAVGIYAIIAKVWGGFDMTLAGEEANFYNFPHLCGAAIGGLYGGFVELDDSVDSNLDDKKQLKK